MISNRISNDKPPQMKNFEKGHPHSNALLQSSLKLEFHKPAKSACHPTICYVIYDVKLFTTVYHIPDLL